jgi:hypothetical protein
VRTRDAEAFRSERAIGGRVGVACQLSTGKRDAHSLVRVIAAAAVHRRASIGRMRLMLARRRNATPEGGARAVEGARCHVSKRHRPRPPPPVWSCLLAWVGRWPLRGPCGAQARGAMAPR